MTSNINILDKFDDKLSKLANANINLKCFELETVTFLEIFLRNIKNEICVI